MAPEFTIPSDVSGEIALKPCLVIPMCAGRIERFPFFPTWISCGNIDELFALPGPAQSKVRVDPGIRFRERFEPGALPFPLPFRRPFDCDLGAHID